MPFSLARPRSGVSSPTALRIRVTPRLDGSGGAEDSFRRLRSAVSVRGISENAAAEGRDRPLEGPWRQGSEWAPEALPDPPC